jgi:PAS domain S-box-containing protein
MNDEGKTKQQLLNELSALRNEIAALKESASKLKKNNQNCIYEYKKRCAQAEKKYPCIFDSTGTAMVIIEEDTTISLMNRECEKLMGYVKEQVEGKKRWTEFVVREELERLREYHRLRRTQTDSAPKTYETRMIDAQGNVRDIFVTAGIIPGTKKSIASLIDITKRKANEKDVKESEQKFRALVEQLPNTIIYMAALDEMSTTLYVSPQISRILGYNQEEYKNYPDIWTKSLHPDDKDWVLSEVTRCHETGEPFTAEYRIIRNDGQIIWFHDEAHVIKDEQGASQFLLGINIDISDRKNTEIQLMAREDELVSKTEKLEEMNMALRIILDKRERDKVELEEKTLLNVRQLIEPYIDKLKKSGLNEQQRDFLAILESNLRETCSSFTYSLSSQHLCFTPTEIQIANLIRMGKTTKEICQLLNSSEKAVAFHRGNIRRKLGLESRKINLQSCLSAKSL